MGLEGVWGLGLGVRGHDNAKWECIKLTVRSIRVALKPYVYCITSQKTFTAFETKAESVNKSQ